MEKEELFEKSLREAINLDKNDVRKVRGKYRAYNRILADYQELPDGTLRPLGYSIQKSFTDFAAEVNKNADRALDFGHCYDARREYLSFVPKNYSNHGPMPEFNLEGTKYITINPDFDEHARSSFTINPPLLFDLRKIGATGHLDKELLTYAEYMAYVGNLFKQEQAILKEITNIEPAKFKGQASGRYGNTAENDYSNTESAVLNAETIRGAATAFTGADADWAEIDIVTEVELLIVDMFDAIDNNSCNDATKLDIVRFAAGRVSQKRYGILPPCASRGTVRGEGKLTLKPHRTNKADALLADMVNYTYPQAVVTNNNIEYYNDLSALRKAIADKRTGNYVVDDEGSVIPRVQVAKKRGEGFTAFKNMTSKYRELHKDEIDDDDW